MHPRTAYQYDLPSGKTVVMVEPTVQDILTAQRAGDDLTLLQNCVREIDGLKVTYEDLRGKGLSEHLGVKDIMTLTMMVADLTVPSEDEVAATKGSVRVVAG